MPEESPIKEGWLTIEQAHKRYGYAKEYLRQLCRDKALDCYTIEDGKLTFVKQDSLERYMEESKRRRPWKHKD